MPSDAVLIASIVTTPTVVGAVTVWLHRQRLRHERRLHDIDRVRDLLSDAAALVREAGQHIEVIELQSAGNVPLSLGDRESVGGLAGQFEEMRLRFMLWFADDEPVATGWTAMTVALSDAAWGPLETFLATLQGGSPDSQGFGPLSDRWMHDARAVARAHLDTP